MIKMKNKQGLVYVYLVTFFCGMHANTNEESFLKAHQHYEQDDYAQARELYDSVGSKGSAIWYNMGNCHYALGNNVEALVCWKRAQKNAAYQVLADIDYNIDALEKRAEGSLPDRCYSGFYLFMHYLLSPVSLWLLQISFLILWFVMLLMGSFFVRRKRYVIFSFLLIMAIILFFTLCMKYVTQKRCSGIIVQKNTPLCVGPDKEYHFLDLLDDKTEVVVQEKRGEWYRVKYKKKVGWIPVSAIELV